MMQVLKVLKHTTKATKHGLDEACGMGIKNEPIAGMEEGVLGGVGGAIAGSKLGGMAGTAIGGSIGGVPGATIGKAAGAALGGIAGDKMTGDGIFEEPADEVVDTMASYGAMGEAESSPDGDVGADDDGAYDKYDWDAQTVARKGIDEDEMLKKVMHLQVLLQKQTKAKSSQ